MKNRFVKALTFGIVAAFIVGILLATIMTLIDWTENPSEIFHDDTGTRWNFVYETFSSWLWPTSLFAFPIITLIRFFIGSKKQD